MPNRQKKVYRRSAFRLSLGSRYYSEDYFLDDLSHLGLSRMGFRAWCRALGVPLIFIGDAVFLNIRKFEIALEACSQIGQPDFLAPGSAPLKGGRKPTRYVTKLDPDFVRENYETFVAELLIGYLRPNNKPIRETVDDAYDAAKQWALYEIAHRPQELQSAYAKKALAAWRKHRDFSELHNDRPADPTPEPRDPEADEPGV